VSGDGVAQLDPVDARELRLGVAATRWHEQVTDALLDRALSAAAACGV
jgi:6,7-dimethyl-8-ribityllumazine synthase